jgi:hypothetical protein
MTRNGSHILQYMAPFFQYGSQKSLSGYKMAPANLHLAGALKTFKK